MLRRSVAVLAVSLFAASAITACGNTTNLAPLVQEVQQPTQQQIETQSLKGIYSEIEKAKKETFKELDKNGDKTVTPDEFGVSTADQFQEFRKVDSNKDGKISEKEWMPGFLSKSVQTLQLRHTARSLFKRLDKSRDNLLSPEELNSGLISPKFAELFSNFDKDKTKGKLSKSEFENLFAHISVRATTASTSGL